MRKITSLNEDMETLRKSKADTERLVTTSKARIGSLEKEKDGLSKEKNVVKQVLRKDVNKACNFRINAIRQDHPNIMSIMT